MSHPLVVHKQRDEFDVYVGRPTEWGNPYSHKDGTKAQFKVGSVEEAIEQFRHHLWRRLQAEPNLVRRVAALHGKTLACWCAPGPCHAEVLVAASAWAVAQLQPQGDPGASTSTQGES